VKQVFIVTDFRSCKCLILLCKFFWMIINQIKKYCDFIHVLCFCLVQKQLSDWLGFDLLFVRVMSALLCFIFLFFLRRLFHFPRWFEANFWDLWQGWRASYYIVWSCLIYGHCVYLWNLSYSLSYSCLYFLFFSFHWLFIYIYIYILFTKDLIQLTIPMYIKVKGKIVSALN